MDGVPSKSQFTTNPSVRLLVFMAITFRVLMFNISDFVGCSTLCSLLSMYLTLSLL